MEDTFRSMSDRHTAERASLVEERESERARLSDSHKRELDQVLKNNGDSITKAKVLVKNAGELVQMASTYLKRWIALLEKQQREQQQYKSDDASGTI